MGLQNQQLMLKFNFQIYKGEVDNILLEKELDGKY